MDCEDEKLQKILIKITGVSPKFKDNLFDSGLLDSLNLLDLVGEVEKKFNIELHSDLINAENFSSIEKILNTIKITRLK